MIKLPMAAAMAFEPFSLNRLAEVLQRHPITQVGQAFIDQALAVPSRNVQGSTRNVISDLPCPKMGGNAQTESWTAEHPFTLAHIFNPNVYGYVNQPPSMELRYQGRNQKRVRSSYTADCIRFDIEDGVVVEEWKPESVRVNLEEKFPGKFLLDENGQYTRGPAADIVNSWGGHFIVRFSSEISYISHLNRRFLYSYLTAAAAKAYGPKLASASVMLNDFTCCSYQDLLSMGLETDVLNWALATGQLHINFDSAPIATQPSSVMVFRHEETLRAWTMAVRPDNTRPNPVPSSASGIISIGDIIIFDGQRLTVQLSGATAIHVRTENNQFVTLNHRAISDAIRTGTATLSSSNLKEINTSRFWSASPSTILRAIKKLDALEKKDSGIKLDSKSQYSEATYRRWRRAIREGEQRGESPVEALLDFVSERGFHGPHIDHDFDGQLTAWIQSALEDPKAPSTHSIYYDIARYSEAAGMKMIAKSSFYERVKKIRSVKTIRKSLGHKVAYQVEPINWMLDLQTPTHCERAMELVHFDSTLLDIELRSSMSGDTLGRPWLSLAVCAFTRKTVGMYLSFFPPGYLSSMMLLADIVQRYGRLPDAIIHDGGSEFKVKDWKHALTSLGIIRHVRPKSCPRFGAILERMFGVVTEEFLNNLAGNTKIRKNVRQISPGSDASAHSGLWLADLYYGLEEYIFSNYNLRKHPATLVPPGARYESSLITHGARLHRLKNLDEILPVLMPTAEGRPRKIDPSRGLYVNHRFYGHPELTDLSLRHSTTSVKPIPFDPGIILAFIKGNWVVCKSNLHGSMAQLPDLIKRCIFEEWRREQLLVQASSDESRKKLSKQMEDLNQKAIANVEYWKDRENRTVLAVASFEQPTTESQGSSLASLDEMMQGAISRALAAGNLATLISQTP